jgi:hypothetical protein
MIELGHLFAEVGHLGHASAVLTQVDLPRTRAQRWVVGQPLRADIAHASSRRLDIRHLSCGVDIPAR